MVIIANDFLNKLCYLYHGCVFKLSVTEWTFIFGMTFICFSFFLTIPVMTLHSLFKTTWIFMSLIWWTLKLHLSSAKVKRCKINVYLWKLDIISYWTFQNASFNVQIQCLSNLKKYTFYKKCNLHYNLVYLNI